MKVLGNAAHYACNLGTQLGLNPHLARTLRGQAQMTPLSNSFSLVLETVIKHTALPSPSKSSIDTLGLHGIPIKWEGMAHLGKMPDSILQRLSRLVLHSCRLDSPTWMHLETSFSR